MKEEGKGEKKGPDKLGGAMLSNSRIGQCFDDIRPTKGKFIRACSCAS